MLGREVQLYAIKANGGLQTDGGLLDRLAAEMAACRDGSCLHQYPAVKVDGAECMPSGGAFANPADKADTPTASTRVFFSGSNTHVHF